jgi:hypothetical protein
MTYILVKWLHEYPNEPVLLFSELDAQRFETRKVEVFRDGRQGYASVHGEFGGSALGVVPTPELTVIGANPEFDPETISKSDFENVWSGRTGKYMEFRRRD